MSASSSNHVIGGMAVSTAQRAIEAASTAVMALPGMMK
jgi:hypothetical protein